MVKLYSWSNLTLQLHSTTHAWVPISVQNVYTLQIMPEKSFTWVSIVGHVLYICVWMSAGTIHYQCHQSTFNWKWGFKSNGSFKLGTIFALLSLTLNGCVQHVSLTTQRFSSSVAKLQRMAGIEYWMKVKCGVSVGLCSAKKMCRLFWTIKRETLYLTCIYSTAWYCQYHHVAATQVNHNSYTSVLMMMMMMMNDDDDDDDDDYHADDSDDDDMLLLFILTWRQRRTRRKQIYL